MKTIGDILAERVANHLPPPNRIVWLDCVQSRYFMRLSWRDELCEIGNADDSARRRKHLLSIDRKQIRAVVLLIDQKGAAEVGPCGELSRATWHRIELSSASGIPALVAADFDLDANTRELRHVRYLGVRSELERRALTNVFSLDFLPDADLGNLERGNPNTPPRPLKPRPRGGVVKEFVVSEKEKEVPYQEPLVVDPYQRMV